VKFVRRTCQKRVYGNQPSTVGRFVSRGCIRMFNEDVTDLFGRVGVVTPVVVTR
jgi:lipoprotein-anchoring transpeptidase ErfK/SrfK